MVYVPLHSRSSPGASVNGWAGVQAKSLMSPSVMDTFVSVRLPVLVTVRV